MQANTYLPYGGTVRLGFFPWFGRGRQGIDTFLLYWELLIKFNGLLEEFRFVRMKIEFGERAACPLYFYQLFDYSACLP